MSNKISLGSRMKHYEGSTNYRIIPRIPIVIRIDGKNFHTLTKQMKCLKPYDITFSNGMVDSAREVAKRVQGCMLAYVQSDEISLAIRTDQSQESTPWFDNRVQKIVSVAASVSAAVFNRHLTYDAPYAAFDCRVFPLPNITEMCNYLIWRQQDCTKNSISSAAYYEVGEKVGRKTAGNMLHKLNQDERQELLFKEAGINWNDYDPKFKRGVVLYRKEVEVETENDIAIRKKWCDEAPPIFTSEVGREFLTNVLGRDTDGKTKE